MATLINVADIVEENGRTNRENNLEEIHDIPIGTLVEVKYDKWHSGGACEKIHARLWVVSHDRDCDGTPLYSLSPHKTDTFEGARIVLPSGFWGTGTFDDQKTILNLNVTKDILNSISSGFAREALTPVEVTKELEDGVGALRWES
jgi:hypothetical protein